MDNVQTRIFYLKHPMKAQFGSNRLTRGPESDIRMYHSTFISVHTKNTKNKSTGCFKKTHLKEMCDFLTLKMLP